MGLDIGVVKIEYLERPDQPMYGFMQALRSNSMVGLADYFQDIDRRDADDDLMDDGDEGVWNDGGFCEFGRNDLTKRAIGWGIRENLPPVERMKLLAWVANLPWQDDFLMLHLGG